MKFKNINAVLFIALILAACAPVVAVVSPTETTVPIPTSTPIPPSATIIAPTSTLENPTATSMPTGSLSEQGPWLFYVHNSPHLAYADVGEVPAEFILLNQDGSGRTSITPPECRDKVTNFLNDGPNSANYIAQYGNGLYLLRPSEATGMRVYEMLRYSVCHNYFSGDINGGLLASFYQATKDVSPELLLYELPSGKIRERFPLVQCSKDTKVCEKFHSNWSEMVSQIAQWSPNGRYLAFVAVLDAASSDLFVYDSQNGNLRRLTNGPDWVGPIEWSPDGTQIIMQELLNDGDIFFDPYSKAPSSVWSVSVSTSESKLLYSTGGAYTIQNILLWLDDQRFIAYQGFLVNADQALDLRLVDMKTGTNRILFNGVFVEVSLDPVHEVFAIHEQNTEICQTSWLCLVSMKDGTIHSLNDIPGGLSFPDWDEKTGLFVSGSDCENDPQSLQAYNYQGTLRCVPKPTPTPNPLKTSTYPSPDGKWTVSVQDGLWLETKGKAATQLSQETVSDVIWCPDSSCFFFSVLQQNHQWSLYHVSLPELTIKLVDNGIQSSGSYQWLGGEK